MFVRADVIGGVDIRHNAELIGKAVTSQETRLAMRAMRKFNALRKKLTPEILASSILELTNVAGMLLCFCR